MARWRDATEELGKEMQRQSVAWIGKGYAKLSDENQQKKE